MSKKGGYVIVDLKGQSITAGTPFTLDGVTARLDRAKNKACLLSGFAIGNEEKRDVFVDLQKTEDGYVALFGKYTITIEDDEVTITDGGILLDNIVDSQGNKRFVEGDLTTSAIEGVTFSYAKWSLSGSHLMVVLAGTVADETVFASEQKGFAEVVLPDYIANKIYPVWADSYIELQSVRLIASNWTAQYLDTCIRIIKASNLLAIFKPSGTTLTLTADRSFRIQFDLLIDTAE